MRMVRHHGRKTAYRQTNFDDGTNILYVHGAGGRHRLWVEQYGPQGVGPSVAVDLTGHGESDQVDLKSGTETLNAYADDVVAVATETKANVLVGNSLGGAVVLWVALERKLTLDALILCGTGAKIDVDEDLLGLLTTNFERAVEIVHAPNRLFHDVPRKIVQRSKETMLDVGATVTERDYRTCDAFDIRSRLDEVDVRALAITGEHDGLTPPSYTEYLGEHIPRGRSVVLDDCAHLSMLESPGAWNNRVSSFLS